MRILGFRFKILNSEQQKGLTTVEFIVIVSIIFITAFIVSANYPEIQKELALQRASHKIAQDLRRAQTAAMSAKCNPCKIIFKKEEEGYEIKYEIPGQPTVSELVNLEKGVEITSLFPTSPLTISFSPPNPTTSINGEIFGLDAEIVIFNGIRSKSVKINNIGRIEIE